jgi:mono/diheme cytochrome c family protein
MTNTFSVTRFISRRLAPSPRQSFAARASSLRARALRLTLAIGMAMGAANAVAAADPALIRQGQYLARAGDCIACHSAVNGKEFAGGLAMSTPVGKVYSTNITPDKEHGIGKWSYQDFDRLMRTGVTPRGYTVYPAMPYPSYSRLSEPDMKALYAYFMDGVRPEAVTNRKADIPWPLSMRFPLTVWRWLFAPEPQPFIAPVATGAGGAAVGKSAAGPAGAAAGIPAGSGASADAQVLRGTYLVEGLGHCGACHTARGVGLQEKALVDGSDADFLAGGAVIDGWTVPSLRNEHGGGLARWSEKDIVDFLKTGRNPHSASFGAMNDVVVHSTQYLTPDDLAGMAKYLKTLAPKNPAARPFVEDATVGRALSAGRVDTRGALLYLNNCAGCHRSDGKGYSTAFPALAGNSVLQTNDPTSAINIVLSGGAVPATHAAPSALAMAPYADRLDDAQIADVVSFIQTSWGNQGSPATAKQVAKVRKIAIPLAPLTEASFAAGRTGTLPAPHQVPVGQPTRQLTRPSISQ